LSKSCRRRRFRKAKTTKKGDYDEKHYLSDRPQRDRGGSAVTGGRNFLVHPNIRENTKKEEEKYGNRSNAEHVEPIGIHIRTIYSYYP
jgi:hypothetical protein